MELHFWRVLPLGKVTLKKREIDILKANWGIVFYILNLTSEEIYHAYHQFYCQFRSFNLEKAEFFANMDYFGKLDVIGRERIWLALKVIDSEEFSMYGRLTDVPDQDKVENNLAQSFFSTLRMLVPTGASANQKKSWIPWSSSWRYSPPLPNISEGKLSKNDVPGSKMWNRRKSKRVASKWQQSLRETQIIGSPIQAGCWVSCGRL